MNWLSGYSLCFVVESFLLKDLRLSDRRLLHGCCLGKAFSLRFRRSNVALLTGNINKLCNAEFQFLRGISVLRGDSRFLSLYAIPNRCSVIELLTRFVPAVNSMLHSLDHLLVSATILIAFSLWSFSWNRSTVIVFNFSEIIFTPTCISPKNVVWQPGFCACVYCRQWCGELSLSNNFVFNRRQFGWWHLALVSRLPFTWRNNSAAINTLLRSCWFLCLRNQSNSSYISWLKWIIKYVYWVIDGRIVQATCACLAYNRYSVSFILCLKMLKTLSGVHRF